MALEPNMGGMTDRQAKEYFEELEKLNEKFDTLYARAHACATNNPTSEKAKMCKIIMDHKSTVQEYSRHAQLCIHARFVGTTKPAIQQLKNLIALTIDNLRDSKIPAIALLLSAGIAYIAARRTDTAA